MSQMNISEEHFLQSQYFITREENQSDTLCSLEFTMSTSSLYNITGIIAVHYKNVIDITSKCNSIIMFIFLKSTSYIRESN
jgi:hypothetical protein